MKKGILLAMLLISSALHIALAMQDPGFVFTHNNKF
jgi:hypothetical protein